MEKWQKEYIVKNLCDLIADIDCNVYLVSYLRQFGVLSDADEDKLQAVGRLDGDGEKKHVLLKILMTRRKAYEYLVKTLFKCRQSGALLKLLAGFTINLPGTNPFELCEIELNVVDILSKDVIFGGKIIPLKDVCKDIKPELLSNLITSAMDATTYENLLSEKPIEFIVDMIPKPIPYYIPRTLVINTQLDPNIFDDLKSDIFCIEGIELYQLSALSKRQGSCITDKSRNQIHKLTARFILLEHRDHFQQIADKTQRTVHWIKREHNNFFYVMCSTGTGIQTIQKFVISSNSQQLSEDDFLSRCQDGPSNATILYDSPGMGKSVLLARLAQKTKENHPESNVIFLLISELISKVRQIQKDPNSVTIKQALAEKITRNGFGQNIMKTLLDSKDHQIELFLDAFDELPGYDFEFANRILSVIAKECGNTRMYVTTRRHRRDVLEEKFGKLGYNILPFDHTNKLSFFLKFWESEHGLEMTGERKKFAECILKTMFNEMSNQDGDIGGIPFQCRMLAEIYAGDAKIGGRFPTEAHYQLNSIFQVYKHFIDTKFTRFCRNVDKQMYYDFHVRESLRTLFPEKSNLFVEKLRVPKNEIIYRIGILEPPKSDSSIPEFTHRTLAEYFAADFLASSATTKHHKDVTECDLIQLFFQQALLCSKNDWKEVSFENPVICRFLNFFLSTLGSDEQNVGPVKTAIRKSKLYNSNTIIQQLGSSLRIDAANLYLHLLKVYLDLDEFMDNPTTLLRVDQYLPDTENWKKAKRIELVNCLNEEETFPYLAAIAAEHSSLNLVKISCDLLESVTGKKVHQFQYDEYYSPMHRALERGHYQIFEYLLSFDKEEYYKMPLLHWCMQWSDDGQNVGDTVQIIKRILNERPDLVNKPHPDCFNKVPLLVHGAHFSLIKILIEAGADLTQTREYKENIAHLTAKYFSAEEYHELVQIIIYRNAQIIFIQRNAFGDTSMHLALIRIDLKSETLELLANKCNVGFNGQSMLYGSELAVAINYGRSERVIKDIIRLGGDKEKLKTEVRGKLAQNYNM